MTEAAPEELRDNHWFGSRLNWLLETYPCKVEVQGWLWRLYHPKTGKFFSYMNADNIRAYVSKKDMKFDLKRMGDEHEERERKKVKTHSAECTKCALLQKKITLLEEMDEHNGPVEEAAMWADGVGSSYDPEEVAAAQKAQRLIQIQIESIDEELEKYE